MLLTPFKYLIKEKCGLSFEDSREAILAEGIRARLSDRAVASPEAYLNILSREPDEFKTLINLITVKETYFFREAQHFTILTEILIPEVAQTIKSRRIRIVCAGCSTGEEPYSVAMALAQKFGPGFRSMFSIVGFDIDEDALCKARRGMYAAHSFRGVPEQVRKGFFDEQESGFRVCDTIRKGVEFLHLNVFSDSYPEAVRNADVIFYRNVSIYFEPEAQQHIFRNLAALLDEKGYLFLSSTETFAHNIGILSLVEKEGVFLYEKGVEVKIGERRKSPVSHGKAVAQAAQGLFSASADKTLHVSGRKMDESHKIFDQTIALAEAKKYDAALQLTERLICLQPTFIKAYMLRAGILINLQRLDDAKEVCRHGLEFDQWSVEGHILLGLIAKIQGDLEEAVKRLREAVYIKSSCWLPHFYLGEIYRAEGDWLPACREFEVVINLLEKKGVSDHGLTFFSLSFPMEQVVHLCRHNLADMKHGRL